MTPGENQVSSLIIVDYIHQCQCWWPTGWRCRHSPAHGRCGGGACHCTSCGWRSERRQQPGRRAGPEWLSLYQRIYLEQRQTPRCCVSFIAVNLQDSSDRCHIALHGLTTLMTSLKHIKQHAARDCNMWNTRSRTDPTSLSLKDTMLYWNKSRFWGKVCLSNVLIWTQVRTFAHFVDNSLDCHLL